MKNIFSLLIIFYLLTAVLFSQTWNAMGSGADGPIGGISGGSKGLEVINNILYVGGGFSMITGVQVNGVAVFNGNYFDSLGSGVQFGEAKAFAKYNNKIYIAGDFVYAGNLPNTERIAEWNNAQWSSITTSGAALNTINATCVYNGELYVGGYFDQIGGINAYRIARWNGTTWGTVGTSFIGQCEPKCMTVYNGELYVGGQFGLPGGPNNNFYNLVRWNGTKWDSVGGQFGGGYVNSLCVDTINNLLYAGGGITFAGTIPIWSVAKWDGTNLSSPGGFGITDGAYSMCMFNNELYVGGSGWSDTNLAKYDGVSWIPIVPSPRNGSFPGEIKALAVYDSNLYVGGWFTQIGTLNANYIACYGNTCPQGVGINELQVSGLKFKVFPNPAKNNITIETEENRILIAHITNPLGQKVAEKKFQKKIEVKVSSYGKGLFLVEVCSESGIKCHTEKVLIE